MPEGRFFQEARTTRTTETRHSPHAPDFVRAKTTDYSVTCLTYELSESPRM